MSKLHNLTLKYINNLGDSESVSYTHLTLPTT